MKSSPEVPPQRSFGSFACRAERSRAQVPHRLLNAKKRQRPLLATEWPEEGACEGHGEWLCCRTRYTEARLTPSTRAIVATSCPPLACIARAVRSFASVHTVGRPPTLPRARAAARPAAVLSRMRSRSNSERAPKTWNTRRPPGVLVSMFSVRLTKATPRCSRSAIVSIRCRSDRPSRSRRHTTTGVAGPGLVQQGVQRRAGLELAGGLVHEDAVAAGGL